jgi:hypothetical protein
MPVGRKKALLPFEIWSTQFFPLQKSKSLSLFFEKIWSIGPVSEADPFTFVVSLMKACHCQHPSIVAARAESC